MKSAVSIAVEGLGDGCVAIATRGKSTSSGSQTVYTFDTLWRGTSNAPMLLLLMMIATFPSINAPLCSVLICNNNKHGFAVVILSVWFLLIHCCAFPS